MRGFLNSLAQKKKSCNTGNKLPTIHSSFFFFSLPFLRYFVFLSIYSQCEETAAGRNKKNQHKQAFTHCQLFTSSVCSHVQHSAPPCLPNRGGSQLTLASQWESKKVMTSPIAMEAPSIRVLISPSLFLVRRILTFGNWAI